MVKNTKGGKGAKSLARKNMRSSSLAFPVPSNDLECFAVVVKIFGPTCDVLLADGSKLLCHIRNKFKGRHKSGNFIAVGSILLIGLREWESDANRKNCDLLFVYDITQTHSIAELYVLPVLPSDKIGMACNVSDIVFDDAVCGSDDDENKVVAVSGESEVAVDDDVNFDDI